MKLSQAIELIRYYKYYIKYQDVAEALCVTSSAIRKRLDRDSDLRYEETFMLAKHFSLPVRLFFKGEEVPNTFPVEWYKNTKLELYHNPNMKQYHMNFDIAYDYNRNFDKDDFKIISMIGDKLNGGGLWCKDKNTLLLDVTYKTIKSPGLYAYECEDGNYVSMAYIEKQMDGDYKFSFSNPAYKPEIRTLEFLKEVKFKIIGRIIKNLHFFA